MAASAGATPRPSASCSAAATSYGSHAQRLGFVSIPAILWSEADGTGGLAPGGQMGLARCGARVYQPLRNGQGARR
jgi:hypothetical protein